jgi:hypothetical protein
MLSHFFLVDKNDKSVDNPVDKMWITFSVKLIHKISTGLSTELSTGCDFDFWVILYTIQHKTSTVQQQLSTRMDFLTK